MTMKSPPRILSIQKIINTKGFLSHRDRNTKTLPDIKCHIDCNEKSQNPYQKIEWILRHRWIRIDPSSTGDKFISKKAEIRVENAVLWEACLWPWMNLYNKAEYQIRFRNFLRFVCEMSTRFGFSKVHTHLS